MKFLRNMALGVLLVTSQFAYSANSCDPCDPCYTGNECNLCDIDWCDISFSAYVDALYWHVCSGDTDRDFFDGENTRYVALNPDYTWGWRIGAAAHWDCWDLGLRYTSFNSKTTEDFTLNFEESSVELKYDFDYDVLDLELGRTCCVCDGLTLRPFAGGKFAWIDVDAENLNSESQGGVKMDYNGYGLYVGLGGRWQLCSISACDCDIPLALVSRLSTGVMDSDFKQTFSGNSSVSADSIKDCLFVPVHEVYLGLEFRMCGLCNADAFLQLGYEAQYWGWREYDENDDITHLGLGGLVLRFGANF